MIVPDWSDAECRRRGVKTRTFFYEEDFPRSSKAYELARERARLVCQGCPIREECAEFAIETNQEGGIWGGMTDTERKDERKIRYRLAQLQLQADLPSASDVGYAWSR